MAKTDSDISPDIAALSFEEALAELEKIVGDLERGKVKLDDAIAAYTRGAQLKRHCETKLAAAKAKVEKIVVRPDGGIVAEATELG
ncbi:MAG: exodeoxyribonuclease VII small subunit [Alphaproteobacteria bacterium]